MRLSCFFATACFSLRDAAKHEKCLQNENYARSFHDRCWNKYCTSVNAFSLGMATDFVEEELWRKGNSNFILSPFSVSTALAMLFIGSRGNTKTQVANTFRWKSFGNEPLSPLVGQLLLKMTPRNPNDAHSKIAKNETGVYSLANNIWIADDIPLLASYERKLIKNFAVRPSTVPFGQHWNEARERSTQWGVAQKTDDKIKKLLSPDTISSRTRMVLANAIYFKGVWDTPFSRTFTGRFFPTSYMTNYVNVQYMYERNMPLKSHHDRCLHIKLVELPYEDGQFTMLIAMPLKSSVTDNARKITMPVFNKWLAKLRQRKIDFLLPKFKVETSVDLVSYLKQKNITDLFQEGTADLSGITTSDNRLSRLYVSAAMHKAFFSVGEKGTITSGATGIGIETYSKRRQIVINRPFFFYILCRRTSTIMFTGKVSQPVQ